MIIHLNKKIDNKLFSDLINTTNAIYFEEEDYIVLITPFGIQEIDKRFNDYVNNIFIFDSDIQLASINYKKKRKIEVGNLNFGGNTNNLVIIGGPCGVESEQQIFTIAYKLKELGINILRAGCFKPRTSPYTFQGMGIKGLKLLDKVRKETGLLIITEVRDATHVNDVIEYADIVQIGAKAMYDHGVLRACAGTKKPVLIKRGFGSTLQEFVQSSEFILCGGNDQVILCERGIRTFETKTRFTLDLCGAVYLKYNTNLPIVIDPSHAFGYSFGIHDLAKAAVAMGIDGLMIETHNNPSEAKSDASQQVDLESFEHILNSVKGISKLFGQDLI